INELAFITEEPGSLTRTYGTRAFINARAVVAAWMKELGLTIRIDNIGNIRGRLLSRKPNAKTLVLASHIDSVVNAGKFDGPLGIVMALEMVEAVLPLKDELPFNIEVIAFCDEEGVRFHSTYLGSKAVAGSFETELLDKQDKDGVTLAEVIKQQGGNPEAIQADAIPREEWLGYFEIHIEQGPVLFEANVPVALVTTIAGQQRIIIQFKGVAGHAGTVPMDMRKDALACAAAFILEAEEYAGTHKEKIVATVGRLEIINGASNVIPGFVTCTLDLRSSDESALCTACTYLQNAFNHICNSRALEGHWQLVQQAKPVQCHEQLNNLLKNAIEESGVPVIKLVSGAGHDAVPISSVAPVAMLFVRCFQGISHNPLEDVELKDIAAAQLIADNFLRNLIKEYQT
ncbi:MAG: amidase, hydantoinase/carbamoylase family, partial [Segetibacter sp.]|nr:amidase, hydantoinase/carbamoylase family [Segetibacter sp.]